MALGLVIGNSRLHWGYFEDNALKYYWHSPHLLQPSFDFPIKIERVQTLPFYIASVVPSQTLLWQNFTSAKIITLSDIPLNQLYPTLGIDRALAVLGGGKKYGFPCLVIDGGTALTLTGVDKERNFIGGAILSGLSSQFKGLTASIPTLPQINLPHHLPPRWGNQTTTAIESGIIYTLLSGIQGFMEDWYKKFPQSTIIFTGGDGNILLRYLTQYDPILTKSSRYDESIIFWGIQACLPSLGG